MGFVDFVNHSTHWDCYCIDGGERMGRAAYFAVGVIVCLSFFFMLGFQEKAIVQAEDSNVQLEFQETQEPTDENIPVTLPLITPHANSIEDSNETVLPTTTYPSSGGGSSGGGGGGSYINNPTPTNNTQPEVIVAPDFNLQEHYQIDGNRIILKSDLNDSCFEFDGNNWNVCVEPELIGFQSCVIEGDSLSAGYRGISWWDTIHDYNQFVQCDLNVLAVPGENTVQMLAEYDTEAHLVENKELFFVYAGTNDIWASDNNADRTILDLNLLWGKARLDGYKVVAFTLQANCNLPSEWEQQRLELNQLIRDTNNYDYLIELDEVFPDCSFGYDSDNLHFNEQGYAKVMQEIATIVTWNN